MQLTRRSRIPKDDALRVLTGLFLARCDQSWRDAARGHQTRRFYEKHPDTKTRSLPSILRFFTWWQNSAGGRGCFRASPEVERARKGMDSDRVYVPTGNDPESLQRILPSYLWDKVEEDWSGTRVEEKPSYMEGP